MRASRAIAGVVVAGGVAVLVIAAANQRALRARYWLYRLDSAPTAVVGAPGPAFERLVELLGPKDPRLAEALRIEPGDLRAEIRRGKAGEPVVTIENVSKRRVVVIPFLAIRYMYNELLEPPFHRWMVALEPGQTFTFDGRALNEPVDYSLALLNRTYIEIGFSARYWPHEPRDVIASGPPVDVDSVVAERETAILPARDPTAEADAVARLEAATSDDVEERLRELVALIGPNDPRVAEALRVERGDLRARIHTDDAGLQTVTLENVSKRRVLVLPLVFDCGDDTDEAGRPCGQSLRLAHLCALGPGETRTLVSGAWMPHYLGVWSLNRVALASAFREGVPFQLAPEDEIARDRTGARARR